jgi:hypothetical protein
MSKKESARKRAKESARWAANARPRAPKPATYCVRCGQGLAQVADIPAHNATVHLAGQR